MPKEVTHWLVAQQVGRSMRGTPAGDAAGTYPNCLLLGAILHDAPYYARGRHWRKTMSAFADAIHGKGHDAFALIESAAATTAQAGDPGPATALLVGMISHIAVDSCFHPLIYHETGNYDDPDPVKRTRAVQLHRRFETILDVYFAGTLENITTYSLNTIIKECEQPVSSLVLGACMQTADDFDCPALAEGIPNSLKNFALMQSIYSNPFITRILQTIYPVLPAGLREIASLFYLPRFVSMAPELHEQWSMPDPETGQLCTVTLRELYNNSIQLAIDLCAEMVPVPPSSTETESDSNDDLELNAESKEPGND